MSTDNLFDRIPQWLKSLHEMENELRNAARKGLILRKDEASRASGAGAAASRDRAQ
jgi:hypothetical protein